MPKVAVIMPAAGASRRFRDQNYKKPFAPLAGRAVWLHSAEKFLNRADVKQVIVVIAEEDGEEFNRKFGANIAIMGVEVCKGGEERSDSVQNALAKVKDDIDFVAIHDAARPCLGRQVDRRSVRRRRAKTGRRSWRCPSRQRSSVSSQGKIAETVSRDGLWEAQTPQVFRRELIDQGLRRPRRQERHRRCAARRAMLGHAVTIVEGSPLNLKITTRDDLKLAEQVLKVLPKPKLDGFANPFAGDDMWR